MLEVVEESVNMMEDKDPNGYNLNLSSPILGEKPILVLRGAHSRESSQGPLVIRGPNSNQSSKPKKVSSQSFNVVTWSQGPLVIKGPSSNQPSKPKQVQSKYVPSKLVVNPRSNYNLVDKFQRTPNFDLRSFRVVFETQTSPWGCFVHGKCPQQFRCWSILKHV